MASPDVPAAEPAALRVRDPGQLVAAIPVVIGFHPRDSLVLLAMGGASGRRLGLTVRVDLPSRDDVALVAASAVRGLLADSPPGAVVVVVGGPGGADPPTSVLVDHVLAALAEHRVEVHGVIRAHSTTPGARWECLDGCGCAGVVPDPSETPFAAAAVLDGKVVFADRAELERLVAPTDAERIRRRERLLVGSHDAAVRAGADRSVVQDLARGTATVDTALDDAAEGRLVLDDARVLALTAALAVPAVRDLALLRSAGERADAAEHLWTALCRETPDPEAAEPAALLAASALLRGDGAMANVALDRATGAWPGHRLTGLLRSVAESGMRPSRFRACLTGDPDTARPAAPRSRDRRSRRAR